MPRRLYLDLMEKRITDHERGWRRGLTEYVDGRRNILGGVELLAHAVDHYDFPAVGVRLSDWSQNIRLVLYEKGYRVHQSDELYAVWLREERGAKR